MSISIWMILSRAVRLKLIPRALRDLPADSIIDVVQQGPARKNAKLCTSLSPG